MSGARAWEDPDAAYNAQAPSVIRMLAAEKWKRRALYVIAWGVLPVCLLIGASLLNGRTSAGTPLTAESASWAVNAPPGKAAAIAALTAWLARTPSPLPGAVLQSWDGAQTQLAPKGERGAGNQPVDYVLESDRFTIVRGAEILTATVLVAVGADGSTAVVGTPSVLPVADRQLTDQIAPWFAMTVVTAPAPVVDAVQAWARAWASGDPAALKREILDPEANRGYLPLTGASGITSVSVTAAAYAGAATAHPATLVVRADVIVDWGQERAPAPMTFDLLVSAADTATPTVVAWGPIGSGATLTPYENAITGAVTPATRPTSRPVVLPTGSAG